MQHSTSSCYSPTIAGTDTTDRILGAAVDELADHGLRRFAVEDVARRAGVNRITIYRRFPSRDDLLRAVMLRSAEELFAAVDAAVAGAAGPEERIVEAFVTGLRLVREHPVVRRVLEHEPDVLGRLLVDHGPAMVDAVADYLLRFVPASRSRVTAQVQAELAVRLCLSFVVMPTRHIALDSDAKARAFARRYLAPQGGKVR